jgi:cytochrome c556
MNGAIMGLCTLKYLKWAPLLLFASGCDHAPDSATSGPANGFYSASEGPSAGRIADASTFGGQDDAADAAHDRLPLLPIMLRMSAGMAGLMQALWLENYEEMAAHASAVAGHAQISAQELERIQTELGPELAAFEAADEAVHEASIRMRDAAEARELEAFLEHLATVQRGCVECHSQFRERLRTNLP